MTKSIAIILSAVTLVGLVLVAASVFYLYTAFTLETWGVRSAVIRREADFASDGQFSRLYFSADNAEYSVLAKNAWGMTDATGPSPRYVIYWEGRPHQALPPMQADCSHLQ